MPYSSYPNGFNDGVLIRELPIVNAHAGKVFWVDSNGSRSGKGTFNMPDLTLDAAIGRCVDNRVFPSRKRDRSWPPGCTSTRSTDTNPPGGSGRSPIS